LIADPAGRRRGPLPAALRDRGRVSDGHAAEGFFPDRAA